MSDTQPGPWNVGADYIRAQQEGIPVEEVMARPPEGRQPAEDVAYPYTPSPYYPPPQPRPSAGFAVTALVTGIVGVCLSWVPGLDLVLGIIAVTFGALAWARGHAGKGMAIAGMTMGIITVVLFFVFLFTLGG